MAIIALTSVGTAGITDLDAAASVTPAAAPGDKFLNDGRTAFYINNGNAGTCTATFTAQRTSVPGVSGVGTVTVANYTLAVATTKRGLTPFFENAFTDANGYVNVSCSVQSTVTVAALQFARLSTPS